MTFQQRCFEMLVTLVHVGQDVLIELEQVIIDGYVEILHD